MDASGPLEPAPPPPRWRVWAPLLARVAACAALGHWFLGPILREANGAFAAPGLLGAMWAFGMHGVELLGLRTRIGLFGRIALGAAAGTLLGLMILVLAHAPAGIEGWRSLTWFADPNAQWSGRAFDTLESRVPGALGHAGAALLGLAAWPRARVGLAILSLVVGLAWGRPEGPQPHESAAGTVIVGIPGAAERGWGLTAIIAALPLAWTLAGLFMRPVPLGPGRSARRRALELPIAALALGSAASTATWLRDAADALTGWPLRHMEQHGGYLLATARGEMPVEVGFSLFMLGPGGSIPPREEDPWVWSVAVRGLQRLHRGEFARADGDLRLALAALPEERRRLSSRNYEGGILEAQRVLELGLAATSTALGRPDEARAFADRGMSHPMRLWNRPFRISSYPNIPGGAAVEDHPYFECLLVAAVLARGDPWEAHQVTLERLRRIVADSPIPSLDHVRSIHRSVVEGPASHRRWLEGLRGRRWWTVIGSSPVEHAFAAGACEIQAHPGGQGAWPCGARGERDLQSFLAREPGSLAALAAGLRADEEGDLAGALACYDRAVAAGEDALAVHWAARRAERLRAH